MFLVGIAMVAAIVGLIWLYLSPNQLDVAAMINPPTQIPVSPTPYVQTCHGWNVSLWGTVSKQDSGDGWMTLSGNLWWQNVSADAQPPGYDVETMLSVSRFDPPEVQSFYNDFAGLAVTTNEGFTYPIFEYVPAYNRGPDWLGRLFVPKGMGYSTQISVKVSSQSTGWKLSTPCGTLDFANPNQRTPFNDLNKLPSISVPVQVPNGVFTIDSYQAQDDGTVFRYNFVNKDKGHNNTIYLGVYALGTSGAPERVDLKAGPGQTNSGQFWLRQSLKGRFVLVFQYMYYVHDQNSGLDIWQRGESWAVVTNAKTDKTN